MKSTHKLRLKVTTTVSPSFISSSRSIIYSRRFKVIIINYLRSCKQTLNLFKPNFSMHQFDALNLLYYFSHLIRNYEKSADKVIIKIILKNVYTMCIQFDPKNHLQLGFQVSKSYTITYVKTSHIGRSGFKWLTIQLFF